MEVTSSRPVVDLLPASLVNLGTSGVALGLLVSLAICFYALVPVKAGGALVVVFGWVVLPGAIVAWRLHGAQPRAWIPALLVGPVWGFALSSVVLLALWMSGVRNLAAR